MSTSSSATDTSACFYTAKVEESPPLPDELALDKSQTIGADGASSSSSQRSAYYSARCEAMMQSKGQFADKVEQEIEFSKAHWSEVTRLTPLSEEEQQQNRENRRVYKDLQNDPECGVFFSDWGWMGGEKLGRMIAKGGQAEIFELSDHPFYVMKVFERGMPLSQFSQLCPLPVLHREVSSITFGGTMMEDGRFGFVIERCWGDLRKLIDMAMVEMRVQGVQGAPFPYICEGETLHAADIMWDIAFQMEELHEKGVFHRDLKASNILYWIHPTDAYRAFFVVDYECSIGVMGTGFWRAPEILERRKDIQWEKADVYSFGMTCFEIVTGRIPFEDELDNLETIRAKHDLVIKGRRPKLPSDLDSKMKDLITKCWNPNPNLRPTFSEIANVLEGMKPCHFRLFNIYDELPAGYHLATMQDVNDNYMEFTRTRRYIKDNITWNWIANLADGERIFMNRKNLSGESESCRRNLAKLWKH